MPTTFNDTQFKTGTINSLLGKASNTYYIRYVNLYNGAQPANPTAAPAGGSVFSSYMDLGASAFTAPALGISALASSKSSVATTGISGITFARIYDTSGTAIIDTVASLVGGGGGVIVPSLSSSAGVNFQIDQLSLKLPQANGAVMLNADLVNALVSGWTIAAGNIAMCSSANIKVYSGSAPANADALATGNLLVSFTTAAAGASWGTVTAGSAALSGNLTAVASGAGTQTAGYVRIEKGAYVLQGTVGTTGANFILDTVSITNGATITLTEATISL
jgi:hypothetical protein